MVKEGGRGEGDGVEEMIVMGEGVGERLRGTGVSVFWRYTCFHSQQLRLYCCCLKKNQRTNKQTTTTRKP